MARVYFYPRPPGGGRHLRRDPVPRIAIFLSTPSGWRATSYLGPIGVGVGISIHALRVEGDKITAISLAKTGDFYPRPPGGGRHGYSIFPRLHLRFLSTPSGWRATKDIRNYLRRVRISIHALRVEGDRVTVFGGESRGVFLSTPSGWRATAKTDKVFICFCAKGRRICLFKTRKERICRWRFKKDKFWVLIWCEGSGKSVCALASHCG